MRLAALFLIVLSSFSLAVPGARAEQDFQAWYQSTVWWRLNQAWTLGHYTDFRLHDATGDTLTSILSPRIRYEVHPRLQLQLNTSWVEAYNPEGTRKRDSFRIEFEANPNFPLGHDFTFSLRNRFEWRWIDAAAEFNTRLRLRPQVEWLPFKSGFFRGFFINNEVIYDLDQERVTDNRLVPLGLILHPAKGTDLRFYYVWRHAAGRRQWFEQHVAAIALNVTF